MHHCTSKVIYTNYIRYNWLGICTTTNHQIVIHNNVFNQNSVVKGLIYIQNSAKRVSPVLVAKNTFTNNGAYFGSVGIFIRQEAESGKYPTQVAPTVESELQCGGYLLQENSFTNNGGCTRYSRSMV